MTSTTPSIPITKRIHSSVLAALVTMGVMCIFPLLEQFTENNPQQIQHTQPVPVKITQFSSETTVSDTQQANKSKATPQRHLAPVELPPAPIAPKATPRIVLPPEAPPFTIAPPKGKKSPSPAPSVQNQPIPITQNIPAQIVNDTLPTVATANDSPQADSNGMPDGKSLKFPPVSSKQIKPAYPEYARRRGINGFVILQFIVDIKGRVVEPSVHQANPQGYFETAAIRAIKQWRFSPGRNDKGTPVPCRLQMRIDFILKDSQSHDQYIRLQ